ncbi:glycosyltransferase family 4 protein [Mangrovibrevibacter kandeliae]|uniref:glycosyltransferase family 4 protein n=1 Tax=Mangrovibrevibacter kandeliae TaxID=2968473 RepID=UPI002117DF26|nr:glycosyltransferase [Aurantimonas sp. CSK15Z-1]MCQ8782825.1 glycosyltransferase [Aurantimonas sp. CSK15Z-1]
MLSSASGLGESARLCGDALRADGLAVEGVDLSGALKGDFDHSGSTWPEAAGRGPGTVILHVDPFLVPLALMRLGQRRLAGKRLIGYFAWELERAPEDWRRGVERVHEIWVPSTFTAEAVRGMAGGRPIRVMPHPVLGSGARAGAIARRPADRPFTVVTVFNMRSSFARKNPLAAVAAFREAFGDDPHARLIVKSINGPSYPAGWFALQAAVADRPTIELLDGAMAPETLQALIAEADVTLSLHRAEGFGLVPAEAMAAGRVVVATDYSGSRDFLHAANGMPVPYRLVPARDPQGIYDRAGWRWAEPDIAAAAAALRQLRADPALCQALGEAARRTALETFDPARYALRARDAMGLAPGGHQTGQSSC